MNNRSRAQALVWLTVALPMFVSIAGLAVDGGILLASRRELQSVADGAARAGATRLDSGRLRRSGGTDVELDQSQAVAAAQAYLADRLPRELVWRAAPVTHVEAGPRRVHVLIEGTLQTAFLRVVHIESMPVDASADADVQYGIHTGDGG
jgi:Flp pilus assembly protein TadG